MLPLLPPRERSLPQRSPAQRRRVLPSQQHPRHSESAAAMCCRRAADPAAWCTSWAALSWAALQS